METSADGRLFYLDHVNKTTTWDDPRSLLAPEPQPVEAVTPSTAETIQMSLEDPPEEQVPLEDPVEPEPRAEEAASPVEIIEAESLQPKEEVKPAVRVEEVASPVEESLKPEEEVKPAVTTPRSKPPRAPRRRQRRLSLTGQVSDKPVRRKRLSLTAL